MHAAVKAWAERKGKPFMLLSGPPGVGKTHLAQSAVVHANEQGSRCWYITAYDFDRHMKSFNDPLAYQTPDEAIESWAKVPMVVIDDLGSGYIDKGWTRVKLERFVDLRYRTKSPLLITTNLSGAAFIDAAGERVVSRMRDTNIGEVVLMNGLEDQRAG